jgi:hypothetical protein
MLSRSLPDIREPATERHDGHLVEISHSAVGGSGFVGISFDVSKAPVPPRRYVAEVCSVSIDGDQLRLVFGQRVLGAPDELDSALVIPLSPPAAADFVAMLDSMKDPGLEAIAAAVGVTPQPLLEKVPRPSQVAYLAANIAALGVQSFESCVDFYHASPFVMRNVEKKKQIGLEPVVRITMSTGLLLSLAASARELLVQLPVFPPVGGRK